MRRLMTVMGMLAALLIAACGDDEQQNAGSGGAATTQASATVVEPPPTTPPTEIPITEELPERPPKKSAIFLQCELPTCARFTAAFNEATAALDWDSDVQVFSNANPGAALAQAVARKPDYIAITGIPAAAMSQQLAAADRAGIPVMSCGDTTPPAEDGYTVQCGSTLAKDAEYVGRWIVNDSGGSANVLTVNIPQFKQISTEVEWYESEFAHLCEGCSHQKLDVTVDDVGAGRVAQQVITHLQANPDVDYVHFTFSDLARGMPEALRGANMAEVKLVGVANDEYVVQGVADGTIAAWTMQPVEENSWVMVDAMARLAAGQELGSEYQEQIEVSPSYVLQDPADAEALLADGGNWTGPEGYEEQFKELWKVAP